GAVHRDARLGGRALLGMRGDVHALSLVAIRPPVIGAFEAVAANHVSQREARAAVQAEVAPCEVLVTRPPEDQVLAEQPGRDRAAAREVLDPGDRVPVLDQNGVVDHASGVWSVLRPGLQGRRKAGFTPAVTWACPKCCRAKCYSVGVPRGRSIDLPRALLPQMEDDFARAFL